MHRSTSTGGFSLLELILSLSILAVLAGAAVPALSSRLERSRDTRRLADLRTVHAAIEQYYADHGTWPPASQNRAFGGWDVSHDGDFIPALREAGYLLEDPRDPIGDDRHHYRYYVYPKGSYGCVGMTSFYVLGIREFETEAFAAQNTGCFTCTGRDWNREFDYVIGGGATER